jgi:hypothetical protein
MMDAVTCKNCGQVFEGKYCNNCGEKVLHTHDRSIGHFFEDAIHFITHFDGKFFVTLKTMFRTPGKLSVDYTQGRRQPYFKPVSFFLLLVVLYLLFPLFGGLNMPLSMHVGQKSTYGQFAEGKVEHYLQSHPGMTMSALSEQFAQKSEKTSKLLLFIIIPLSALPLWLLLFRRRPYFYDHLLLATELNSVYLLITFFIFPLLIRGLNALLSLMHLQRFTSGDGIIGIAMYVIFAIYCGVAIRRFYQLKWRHGFIVLLVLLAVHPFIIYVLYKFILFVVAFALVH